MIFHIVTIFPEFFGGPFEHGVVAKAQEAGILDIRIHDRYPLAEAARAHTDLESRRTTGKLLLIP